MGATQRAQQPYIAKLL